MKANKQLVIASMVMAIGVSSIAGLGLVGAASNTNNDDLVSRIAKKFNLKESDVRSVFDQQRNEKQAEHQAEVSARLQKLVDNGKITAQQKTLIENKQKELRAAMDKEREELKAWAENNNIELRYVMGRGMHGDGSRLQQLVDDGTITADQKKLIEDKQAELKTKRDAAKTALDKWASDNGIDTQYLMGGFSGRMHGRGHMGDEMRHN